MKKILCLLVASMLCLGFYSTTVVAKSDKPIVRDQSRFPDSGRVNDDWITSCKWDAKEKRCYCKTSKGKEMPAPKGQCKDAPGKPSGASGRAM